MSCFSALAIFVGSFTVFFFFNVDEKTSMSQQNRGTRKKETTRDLKLWHLSWCLRRQRFLTQRADRSSSTDADLAEDSGHFKQQGHRNNISIPGLKALRRNPGCQLFFHWAGGCHIDVFCYFCSHFLLYSLVSMGRRNILHSLCFYTFRTGSAGWVAH